MKFYINKEQYIDTDQPLDISIPLSSDANNTSAWYCEPVSIEPVRTDNFTGSVAEGGSVNFRNIKLNPHGNGTHTECIGHITEKVYSIQDSLKTFWFKAELISIKPTKIYNEKFEQEDFVLQLDEIKKLVPNNNNQSEALIIRTLPNSNEKKTYQYSNTNPPYLSAEAMQYIYELNFIHLLIDLPSVDREIDNGELICHNIFWNTAGAFRLDKTITEFIYVPENIVDGTYFLNLQITSLVNDASPSKPVIYRILTDK